jgi:hypothetical protein
MTHHRQDAAMLIPYSPTMEAAMRHLHAALGERERRLYAATEALKLGRGGLSYIAQLFDCDEKTVRRGKRDLGEPATLPPGRSRKKGAAESRS